VTSTEGDGRAAVEPPGTGAIDAGLTWAGPSSLLASTLGTVLVVSLGLAAGSAELDDWVVLSFAPGAVGLLLLPFGPARGIAVGLAATLVLPLTSAVLMLLARAVS
jgi:hypothetical protein